MFSKNSKCSLKKQGKCVKNEYLCVFAFLNFVLTRFVGEVYIISMMSKSSTKGIKRLSTVHNCPHFYISTKIYILSELFYFFDNSLYLSDEYLNV